MTTMLAPMAPEAQKAIAAAVRRGLSGLRAEPLMPLSEWAEKYFILAAESSQQSGAWRCWSWQVGIADAMSNDQVEELALQKSKRVGYTKLLAALICWALVHRRRSTAIWQPTDDDRDSYVKTELDPVFAEVPAVREAIAGEATMKVRFFLGAVLHTLGGRAARAFRRITVALALLDEWDAFEQSVEKAGSPDKLAKGRLEGAAYPKFVGGSTPRIKGLSHVEAARERSDVDMRFMVECRHCGVEHPLLWGGKKLAYGFKWTPGMPETVRHLCPHCHGEMTQADFLPGGEPMAGTWVCVRTGVRYGADRVWRDAQGSPTRAPRTVGMHVWAAYSPMRTWVSIVREFEEATAAAAGGNTEDLQVFVNETLGETWEIKSERGEDSELSKRAEDYELRTVPRGALYLTGAVDVQDNRFEIKVKGWGRDLESWLVDYEVLEANPADPRDWDKLDLYLQTRYRQAHGGTLAIDCVGIDSGGHFTHQVYDFCRTRAHRRIYAIAGAPRDGTPIKGPGRRQDVNWKGQVIKGGVVRYEVGTDTAKDLILNRLAIAVPGPGYMHYPKGLPGEYYKQLTAEGRVLQKTSGGMKYRWVKLRSRNEALDLEVYNIWAAQMLDLHRFTPTMWDRRQALVEPPPDLFSQPVDHEGAAALPQASTNDAAPEAAPIPPARPASSARPGFARAW